MEYDTSTDLTQIFSQEPFVSISRDELSDALLDAIWLHSKDPLLGDLDDTVSPIQELQGATEQESGVRFTKFVASLIVRNPNDLYPSSHASSLWTE